MTRAQRFVQWAIRLFIPIGVLGGAGAIAGTLLYSFEQSRDVVSVLSPAHDYGATLVSQSRSCAEGGIASQSTTVYVERRWGIMMGNYDGELLRQVFSRRFAWTPIRRTSKLCGRVNERCESSVTAATPRTYSLRIQTGGNFASLMT